MIEAIVEILRAHDAVWISRDHDSFLIKCGCGWQGQEHDVHVAEQIVALFTINESRLPEYGGSPMQRYKGLKTVRRWSYADGQWSHPDG